jgi:type II secretion system protein N
MRTILLKGLFYAIYILAATAFFLYYLFPSLSIQNHITYQLNKDANGVITAISKTTPAFPPAILLHEINVSWTDHQLFGIKKLKITPALTSFFQTGIFFKFQGRAYQGRISGTGHWHIQPEPENQSTEKKPPVPNTLEAELAGIRISALPAVKGFTHANLSGMLGGKISIMRQGSDNKANLRLIFSDGQIEPVIPFFEPVPIIYKTITIDLAAKNQVIQLLQCTLKSPQFDGVGSGTIRLNKTLDQSALDISGTLKIYHRFLAQLQKKIPEGLLPKKMFDKNGFSFQIKGTFKTPDFRIL